MSIVEGRRWKTCGVQNKKNEVKNTLENKKITKYEKNLKEFYTILKEMEENTKSELFLLKDNQFCSKIESNFTNFILREIGN